MIGAETCGESVVDYMRRYGGADTLTLAEATCTPYYTVYRALTKLVSDGTVVRAGKPRHYTWALTRPPLVIPRVSCVWQLGAVL